MKRVPGFYWVELVHMRGVATISRWNGVGWVHIPGVWASTPRVRKVLSERLAPPEQRVRWPRGGRS